jgi:hypothetical protein
MNEYQFINDMHAHLGRKLKLVLRDVIDTCERVDIDEDIILKIIMAGLMTELMKGAATLGMDEKQFVHMCRIAYREIYGSLRQIYLKNND